MDSEGIKSSSRIRARSELNAYTQDLEAAAAAVSKALSASSLDVLVIQRQGARLRRILSDLEATFVERSQRHDPIIGKVIFEWIAVRDSYFETLEQAIQSLQDNQEGEDILQVEELKKRSFKINFQPPPMTADPSHQQQDYLTTSASGLAQADDVATAGASAPEESLSCSREKPAEETSQPAPSVASGEKATEQSSPSATSVTSTIQRLVVPKDLNLLERFLESLGGRLEQKVNVMKKTATPRAIRHVKSMIDQIEDIQNGVEEVLNSEEAAQEVLQVELIKQAFQDLFGDVTAAQIEVEKVAPSFSSKPNKEIEDEEIPVYYDASQQLMPQVPPATVATSNPVATSNRIMTTNPVVMPHSIAMPNAVGTQSMVAVPTNIATHQPYLPPNSSVPKMPIPATNFGTLNLPVASNPFDSFQAFFLGDATLKAVPVFHGAFDEYPSWRRAAVHYSQVPGLLEDTKLINLKEKLGEKPKKLVRTITMLSPCAIETFFKVLDQEYGDVETIVSSQRSRLRELPKPKLEYEAMRDFVLAVTEIVNCLQAAGFNIDLDKDSFNSLYVKIPPSWTQSYGERQLEEKLSVLVPWLDNKVRGMLSRHRAEKAEESLKDKSSQQKGMKTPNQRVPTRAYATSEDGDDKKPRSNQNSRRDGQQSSRDGNQKQSCPKCKMNNHTLANCSKFKRMTPDERLAAVKEYRLHFRCLTSHPRHSCPFGEDQQKCPVDRNCKYQHHELLHSANASRRPHGNHAQDAPAVRDQPAAQRENPPAVAPANVAAAPNAAAGPNDVVVTTIEEAQAVVGLTTSEKCDAAHTLRLIKIFIRPQGAKSCQPRKAVALIDSGCNRTLIDEQFARSMGLKINLESRGTSTLDGTTTVVGGDVDIEVSKDGQEWLDASGSRTRRKLMLPGPELKWSEVVKKNPKFYGVDVEDVDYKKVKVIIGAGFERHVLPLDSEEKWIYDDKSGILAYRTRLGWSIGGPLVATQGFNYACSTIVATEEQDANLQLVEQLRRFNDLEALGVEPRKTVLARREEEQQKQLDATTEFEDGRVSVKMLWKGEIKHLPPTEEMAIRRNKYLHKKLSTKENLLQQYHQTIVNDLEKGYVRKLSQEEAAELRRSNHWFLPHFVVFHPDKPDRPRRVLDCAAKSQGISLNSLLNAGPNNLANLWGVLLRFRARKFVINADISEMFYQIHLKEEDQRMMAFLWNQNPADAPDVYVNTRHVQGATCSPAVANHAVRAVVQKEVPEFLNLVLLHLYMDDLYLSDDEKEKLVEIAKTLAASLNKWGFKLTKWASNCPEVLDEFEDAEKAPKFREIGNKEDPQLPVTKALGVKWDCQADTLGFSTRVKTTVATSRGEVLSQLASTFDPLLIVGPFTMKGKILFQQVQAATTDWKAPLPKPLQELWIEWLSQLPLMAELSIPRWYKIPSGDATTLHVFSDASNVGYGAVGYFVSSTNQVAFVAAKSRVINRNKPPTTPRGELQALCVGTRLARSIIDEMKEYVAMVKIIFWVDSIVVYYWVRNDRTRYLEFVANRLGEVHDTLSDLKTFQPEIRWVDTKNNPADLISRGLDATELKQQFNYWSQGPAFLKQSEESWPKPPPQPEKKSDPELKKIFISLTTVVAAGIEEASTILEFLQQQKKAATATDVATVVTAEELEKMERELVATAQLEALKKEIQEVHAEPAKTNGGLKSKVFRVGILRRKEVFVDEDGLLRLVTRLSNAEFLSWEEKNPIILPPKHPATELLIRDYHVRVNHHGSKSTLAEMLRKYHLPHSAVRRIVFQCKPCRERQPVAVQCPQAPLHASRLAAWSYAFQETGMDHFGPLEINRKKKCWGLLLVCLTTKAVHIEVCQDLGVASWLNALDRFIARRGKPRTIRCDNGRTFTGGDKEYHRLTKQLLTEEFQQEVTQAVVKKFGIDFQFIPPHTPHYGGCWERMVQEAKRSLKKSTDTVSNLSYDALVTFLTRAEGILNRRPLYIDEDLRIITPSHILSPATEAGYGFAPHLSFARVAGQLNQAIQHFWKIWTRQYLLMISAERITKKNSKFTNLEVGDKVLLQENFASSNIFAAKKFKVATVKEVFPSKDGAVRNVHISDSDGVERTVTVDKLFLCEGDAFNRRMQNRGLQTSISSAKTGIPQMVCDVRAQRGVSDPGERGTSVATVEKQQKSKGEQKVQSSVVTNKTDAAEAESAVADNSMLQTSVATDKRTIATDEQEIRLPAGQLMQASVATDEEGMRPSDVATDKRRLGPSGGQLPPSMEDQEEGMLSTKGLTPHRRMASRGKADQINIATPIHAATPTNVAAHNSGQKQGMLLRSGTRLPDC